MVDSSKQIKTPLLDSFCLQVRQPGGIITLFPFYLIPFFSNLQSLGHMKNKGQRQQTCITLGQH